MQTKLISLSIAGVFATSIITSIAAYAHETPMRTSNLSNGMAQNTMPMENHESMRGMMMNGEHHMAMDNMPMSNMMDRCKDKMNEHMAQRLTNETDTHSTNTHVQSQQ